MSVYGAQHTAGTEALCILSQSVDAHFSSALPLSAPIHGTFCHQLSNQLALPPSTLPMLHLEIVCHLDQEENN